MRLYLVQHGEAMAKEDDPARPLSAKGRVDVERVAFLLARAGVRPARIVHSGKTRAEQTAALLGEALVPPDGVSEAGIGLSPDDTTDWLGEALHKWSEDVMAVGHLPFMGRMVSRLVAGAEDRPLVRFTPGSVVCLERDEGGVWAIAWMVRPELAGA